MICDLVKLLEIMMTPCLLQAQRHTHAQLTAREYVLVLLSDLQLQVQSPETMKATVY